jgi:hypothetical protein
MAEHFIQKMHLKKGALHKELSVPINETIPSGLLHKAEHSENPKLAKRANMADTLKHLRKKHGGKIHGGHSLPRLDRKPRHRGG